MDRLSTLQSIVHTDCILECPECEGDGELNRGRPGGRWNAYIGTWEPDDWGETCRECDGTGGIEARCCPACEEAATDCRCDADELLEHLAEQRADKLRSLYRKALAHELAEASTREAPDEVVHRRVNGRTVIARRLLHRRTIDPTPKGE